MVRKHRHHSFFSAGAIFFFLCCFLLSVAWAETSDVPAVLSLDDCIRLALTRNEKIEGADFSIDAAENQALETRALLWPVLDYRYRAAPVPTDVARALDSFFDGQMTLFQSFHIGMVVPVSTFGQLSTAKRLAEQGVKAARVSREKEVGSTVLQVKTLYYGVLLATEIRHLLVNAVEELTGKIKKEEAKEIPEESPITLLKVKLFRSELEQRLAETIENEELAREGLAVQIAFPPGEAIRLTEDSLRPIAANLSSLDAYLKAAKAYEPDARLADIGVEAKHQQYRLEKMKLMPKAGVGAFFDIGSTAATISGLSTIDDFSDPFNFKRAGVGLEVKGEFDIHGSYSRIRKARAEYLKATTEKEIATRALKLRAKKSYLVAKRAHEGVRQARKAQSMAQQMLFLSTSNLEIGLGERDDYIEALKNLLLTRGAYFKTVFDYNVALADLERTVGESAFSELTVLSNAPAYDAFNGDDDRGDTSE